MCNVNILHPVNKSAAFVVQKPADEASFVARKVTHISSKVPLPTINFTGLDKSHDLTGRVIGRLTILGVFPSVGTAKNRKTCWVTRCRCGRYEVYKGITLRNGNTLCCSECRHISNIKDADRKQLMKGLRSIHIEPCCKCNGKKSEIQCNYDTDTQSGNVICNNCGNNIHFVSGSRISGFNVWNLKNKVNN